jgi:hypothetical protein
MQPPCNRGPGTVSAMAIKRTGKQIDDDGGGYRPQRNNAPWLAAGVAAAAAVIGLILVLAFVPGSSSAAATSDPAVSSPAPTATYAGGGGGGDGGTLAPLPPLTGNGGGLSLMLMGTVAKISDTSITLAGNGPSVTAAINGSIRMSGSVSGVSGIKVGDQVSVQLTGKSSSSLVATTIQDPA